MSNQCIFCQNELDESTKREHILLDALGGRKTTKKAICSECNSDFGSTIDADLTSQVEELRNLLQLPSGSGKPPPKLRGVVAGGQIINFRSDGTPELAGKPFAINEADDGKMSLKIAVKSEEDMRRLIPHIAAKIKITEKALRDLLSESQISRISQRPGTVGLNLSFGGTEPLRSITKACLILWSTAVGNDEVRCEMYADARRFVMRGGNFNEYSIQIDSRSLPCEKLLRSRFGNIFNLIYICSDHIGRVIAHFTLYNSLGWRVILAEQGGEPNIRIGLVSDPKNPGQWSGSIANDVEISAEWLNAPVPYMDTEALQRRFGALHREYYSSEMPKSIVAIARNVFRRHGLKDDDTISEEVAKKIISEIAERVAFHIHGMPHVQSLSVEEIKRLLI